MINLTVKETADFTQSQIRSGGSFAGDCGSLIIRQICTSSKDCAPGSLFVPLKGERFDGHAFVFDALARGALVAASSLSEEELLSVCPEEHREELKELLSASVILYCNDTLRFLGLCGKKVRNLSNAVTGAVTGSCGKTTVKEMTASILKECGRVLYTEANYNNDVGVPLTLLRLTPEYDFAVIEQGASHLKDIARTAEFTDADFALITNVGEAHLEGFGSRNGVYQGKSEILDRLYAMHPIPVFDTEDGVKNAGCGIVPADSEWFASWKKDYAVQFAQKQLLSFGESAESTMRVSDIKVTAEKVSLHLFSEDERCSIDADVSLNITGRHNALNAAAAALLAMLMGADAASTVKGLESYRPLKGRLSARRFKSVAGGCLTLIDDAYNAGYNAVLAALDTLKDAEGERIFVFGDMGELGSFAEELHTKVGIYASDKVDLMLCTGENTDFTASAADHIARHFKDRSEMKDSLIGAVASGLSAGKDVVCLIKGSHSMHMDEFVTALEKAAAEDLKLTEL